MRGDKNLLIRAERYIRGNTHYVGKLISKTTIYWFFEINAVMTERRFAKRFRAVDGALAALSPESGRVGQIQNISLHGLAFQYIADNSHKADLHGTVKLQIMFAGEGVWLEGVPVKRVADIDVSTDTSFSQLPLRRACLQFTSLTATQKKRLQEFIHRYTSIKN